MQMPRSLYLRKNAIDALWVLLITLIFVPVCAWNVSKGTPWILWTLRTVPLAAAMPVGIWLYRIRRDAEILPDLLRQVARRYFEKNGLCFTPTIETTPQGTCLLCIYFQNRHSGVAISTIAIRPLNVLLARRKPAGATVTIECPGGGFGVYRIPFPIPAPSQGKRMHFAVGADTKYPAGRGKLLRLRTGIRVSATRELGTGYQLSSAFIMALFGHLAGSAPSHVMLTLPPGVQESGPEDAGEQEILWEPDRPGDSPIAPRRAAA
jgi:hypothetical protein